jgi:hypothetical protein
MVCLEAHSVEFVQVYKVGKKDGDHGAKTEFDPTTKPITPMGGFVGYGEVKEDYVIIKVCISACFAACRGALLSTVSSIILLFLTGDCRGRARLD